MTLFLAQAPPPEPLPHPEIPAPELIVLPWPWWMHALVIIGALAVVGLILWWLMRKPNRGPDRSERPLKVALRALKDIHNRADILPPADVGHAVSHVLRTYYQARYGIPAPARTTQELFPEAGRDDEPIRRRQFRLRFEPLATLYDQLAYAPLPATSAEALTLVDTATATLEDERLHESAMDD
jgi:hypothetical protein